MSMPTLAERLGAVRLKCYFVDTVFDRLGAVEGIWLVRGGYCYQVKLR